MTINSYNSSSSIDRGGVLVSTHHILQYNVTAHEDFEVGYTLPYGEDINVYTRIDIGSGSGSTDLSNYYTKAESDAKIAEEDQKVKNASRVLLASWRGEDGDPTTAGVALPKATYIGDALYGNGVVNSAIGVATSGIGWENDEIDFTRFVMTARLGMTTAEGAIIYFGYSTTPLTSTGLWDYANAEGIALYIKTGNFTSGKFGDSADKNGIYLMAQGGSWPNQIKDAIYDIGVAESGEQTYRFARWKNKIRIWIDDDYKGELTIPAGATVLGGKFGYLGYSRNSGTRWQLKDIVIEQVNIYDAEEDLGLPTVSDASISGSTLTLNRRGGDDKVLNLPDISISSFNFGHEYQSGDMFYYGTEYGVLLFLVRPTYTFLARLDAADWRDSTWQNYIFKDSNNTGKIQLLASVDNISNVVGVTNSVDDDGLYTFTFNYLDAEHQTQSVSTTPIKLEIKFEHIKKRPEEYSAR